MIIENKTIDGRKIKWILRSPVQSDGNQLSEVRLKIDGETENLDREYGEAYMSPEDFEKLIYTDSIAEKSIFLVAEVEDKIVGFARCVGNKLRRFEHKADFGICILEDYWGYGIGSTILENILAWADEVGIEKISLTVIETNNKAIDLYKKYGFVEEGRLVKDRRHRDGNYYNTVIMGRLKCF
ncbi:Protein N-acetyltransferase, RimJ/RimL family [Acetoanaerobium noterae]|uniref:Protein N-acetyltransferase, RimJ/RimL family n=1 Tax=Acetoanaerobium noterae TaxID=745369 RepID=A0A1T5CYS8_9FIRM|nr:GNAT family N-acetyltransferase [Acetoanaerobium noterae]SKB64493.1 Protein N-acetyltransferase, RimJ/RimL family [Acetoanaerobium noterae]